jgi:DNA polymerase I
MLSPHAAESTLEMEHKKEEFAHLYPKGNIPRPSKICSQLHGLIDIKEQLEFLYSLYPIINATLDRNGLQSAFSEIESPIQSILSSMECVGIGFKAERLMAVEESVKEHINKLTIEAREITNDNTFTLSSPQQVSHYLFDTLGLMIPESVGVGAQNIPASQQHRSTSEETLKAIQKQVTGKSLRIIEIILQFRALNKMLTSYILPYPKLARDCVYISTRKVQQRSKKRVKSGHAKKIHPMWMQTAVRTGRLSCRKPNLQQVPAGNSLGFSPRSAFTSSTKDTCLFACDYSQNEVRILAHMSNDPALIKMFNDPKTTDIYIQMASVISGKVSADVSDEERSTAKQLTLAIMYGMGPNTVASKLGVGLFAAKQFFDSFYGRFKGVKKWKEDTLAFARKNKYVETITGRKRYLDNISSNDRSLSAQAERQAINTVIQGSAADLMKLAMLKMASRITDWRKEGTGNGETGIPPRLILQIHDELLFELVANQADVDKLKETVTRCCTEECVDELQLKVPLKLKCSVGTSWGSMQEILDM